MIHRRYEHAGVEPRTYGLRGEGLPRPKPWPARPACDGADPQEFDATDIPTHLELRPICADCPIVTPCLELAIEISRSRRQHGSRGPDGTWGGVLWRDGVVIKLDDPGRNPVALCGTEGGYYRHLRTLNETPCEDCRTAHRMNERLRKARKRKAS